MDDNQEKKDQAHNIHKTINHENNKNEHEMHFHENKNKNKKNHLDTQNRLGPRSVGT